MPKPILGENGNGMHIHQYLANKGESIFDKDGGLSELGLLYMGGNPFTWAWLVGTNQSLDELVLSPCPWI